MRIYWLVILFLMLLGSFFKAIGEPFKINHGDKFIKDDYIDFTNRGFDPKQDYVDLIGSDENFKIFINTVNGNLYHQRTDYISEDAGFPIRIIFTYNSGSSFKGRFGNFWQFNYNIRYAGNNLNAHKVLVYPDDKSSLFIYDSVSTLYKSYSPDFDSLIKNDAGELELVFTDNILKGFNSRVTANFGSEGFQFVKKLKDGYGNTLDFSYSEDLKLKKISFISGRNIFFEYKSEYLSKILLPDGHEINYTYNNKGNLESVSLPSGKKYLYEYDGCGNLIYISDFEKEIFIDYDENNFVSGFQNHYENLKYKFIYDLSVGKTVLQYPDNSEKYFLHDSLNRSVEYGFQNGFKMKTAWNEKNLVVSKTDAAGAITKYNYDELGKIVSIVNPENSTENFKWNILDNSMINTSLSGKETKFKYDNAGNLLQYTDIYGDLTDFSFFNNGAVSEIKLPNEITVSFLRDENSRLRQIKINDTIHLKINFNQNDNINEIIDVYENKYLFGYDLRGRLVSLNFPNGSTFNAMYSDEFLKTTVKNRLGGTYTFYYDKLRRLSKISDENNILTQIDYKGFLDYSFQYQNLKYNITNNLNKKISKLSFNNNIIIYDYDNRNNLLSVNSNGLLHSFKYSYLHELMEYTNPLGNSVKYTYNKDGKVKSYTFGKGQTVSIEYNKYGNIFRKSTEGIEINYEYDKNNLKTINFNNLLIQNFLYDKYGFLKESKTQEGDSYYFSYDLMGNILSLTKNNHTTSKYNYNESNKISTIIYQNGNEVNLKYNSANLLIEKKDKTGFSTLVNYDNKRRIKEITDENGFSRFYEWDLFNNLKYFRDKNSAEYSFKFSPDTITVTMPDKSNYKYSGKNEINYFKIMSVENPGNISISFLYDKSGNLLKTTDFNTKQIIVEYFPENTLKTITNSLNQKWSFFYDYFNRPININNPENKSKTFIYNTLGMIGELNDYSGYKYLLKYKPDGKLLSAQSQLFKISAKYNSENQLSSFSSYENDQLIFEYDLDNIKKIISSGKDSVTFDYDLLNRIIKKTDESNCIYNYTYQPNGYLQKISSSNGNNLDFQRNKNGKITNLNLDDIKILSINYNNLNQISKIESLDTNISLFYNDLGYLSEEFEIGGFNKKYNYDYMGRIKSISYPEDINEIFNYDLKGNLISFTDKNSQEFEYEYNYLNQPVKYKWGRIDSLTIDYDDAGNIISINEPGNSVSEFSWGPEKRLNSINLYGSGSTEFKYPHKLLQNQYIIQFSTQDTVNYIFDKNFRFGGILKNDFIKISYDPSGRELNNFILFSPFKNNKSEFYDYRYGKLNSIKSGNVEYSVSYSNNSLIPENIKSFYDNYKIKTDSKYRVLEITEKDTSVFKINYKLSGLIDSIKNGNEFFAFNYDFSKKLVSINGNYNNNLKIDYNSENISKLSDNSGNSLTMNYDNKSNIRGITKLDNKKTEYLYDTFTNLIIAKNETLDESGYKYNSANLLVNTVFPDLSKTNFSYDKYFNTINITSDKEFDAEMNMEWNNFGIIKKIEINYNDLFTTTLTNDYEKKLKINNYLIRELKVNNSNCVDEIKIYGNKSVRILKENNISRFQLPNGLIYYFEKMADGSVIIKIINSSGQSVRDYSIFYDISGRFTGIEDNGRTAQNIVYDNKNRIKEYTIGISQPVKISYTKDDRISNINSNLEDLPRIFDIHNRLVKSGETILQNDERGNLIKKVNNQDSTEFKYDFENKLISCITSGKDTLNLLYSSRNHLIGITGEDSVFYFPVSHEKNGKFPYIRSKINNAGTIQNINDFIEIMQEKFAYRYDFELNEEYFPLIYNENTILGYSDKDGNYFSLAESISPFGDMKGITSNISEFIYFKNMIYMPQIKLFYDGERFYDSEIKNYLQEKYFTNNNILNPKDLENISTEAADKEKYFAVSEDVLFPMINPFDNRFTKIRDEANPYKILEEEINSHFNNFKYFGLNIINNYKIPAVNTSEFIPLDFENIIWKNDNVPDFRIIPNLPSEMFDTLFNDYSPDILPKQPITKPLSSGIKQVYEYLKLTDIPENSVINKILKKILEIPDPLSEIKFSNIHDESPVKFDLETAEKLLKVYNSFSPILKDNLSLYKNDDFHSLKKIRNLLPENTGFDEVEINNVLEPKHYISQIISDYINPVNFFNDKVKTVNKIINENISNYIDESFSINPADIYPGRTLYRKKYIPLPFSNDSENNLPDVNLRKIRLNFKNKKK